MRVGLQEGDLESIERAAYSLKSTAGHLRILTMQVLAGNIERLAMAAQREAIAGPLHDLEAAFARIAPYSKSIGVSWAHEENSHRRR